MNNFKTIIVNLLLFWIFLLPWQTRWIYQTNEISNHFSESTSLFVYGTEILLGIILFLSIVYFGFSIIQQKTKSIPKRSSILFLGGIGGIFLTSILLGPNKELASQKTVWYIMATGFFLLLVALKPRITQIMKSFVGATIIQGILAIQQFISQEVWASKWLGMANQLPNVLGTPVIEINGERIMRVFGSLPHPNILGGVLAVGIVFIIALLVKEKSKQWQYILYTGLFLNTAALFMSASRSATLALFIALFGYYIYSSNQFVSMRPILNKTLGIVVLIFVIFSIFNYNYTTARLDETNRLEQKSVNDRVEQYYEAWQVWGNNWLTGTGPGNYITVLTKIKPNQNVWDYQPVHNIYVIIILEFGLLIIPFLTLVWLLKNKLNLKLISIKNENSVAFRMALLSLFVIGLFDHYLITMYVGIMLGAMVLAGNVEAHKSGE